MLPMRTSISADGFSEWISAPHVGRFRLDVDFDAGVTGSVKILTRQRPSAPEKYLRFPADNAVGDVLVWTGSDVMLVPGNSQYQIELIGKAGVGSVAVEVTEVEKP